MGTDITMMVEGRIPGRDWIPLSSKRMWPNEPEHRMDVTPVLFRNYELFSILADVRNRTGRGHSEIRTVKDPSSGRDITFVYDTDDGGHDPLIPIAAPRGMPEDVTSVWGDWLADLSEHHHIVYHDHSFLTLAELRAGQWDQVVYRDAVLDEAEYRAWKDEGVHPQHLARGMGGEGTLVVSEEDYETGRRGRMRTGIKARWKEGTVADATETFQVMMNAMEKAADMVLGGPENIRVLFAFDS